jgi:alpha-D-ribose 1-methylphosphonate 5-triphosphate synthase subunit PhnG
MVYRQGQRDYQKKGDLMQRENLCFLLQQCGSENEKLFTLVKRITGSSEVRILSAPTQQTLMVPVNDQAAGTKFYSGEILVTQTIAEVNGQLGWGMVMDSRKELSLALAICDAAFAAGVMKDSIVSLAEEGGRLYENRLNDEARKAASTKVSFEMMADMTGNM